jgi:hypothetical protein
MNNIQNFYQVKLFIWFLIYTFKVKQKASSYVVSFTLFRAIRSNFFFSYLGVMAQDNKWQISL